MVDVAWPHNFLATRDIGLSEKGIPYNALDLRLLTLGELEILALPSLSSEERRARSTLLKDILYYAANYEWGDLLRLHASVLTEVERGTRQWTDSTARLEQQILLQASRKSSITNLGGNANSKVSQGGDKQKRADYWCFDFNYKKCTLDAPHKIDINGKEFMGSHFCAKCFAVSKVKAGHPASSDVCPNKK